MLYLIIWVRVDVCVCVCVCAGNTKGGSITVPLTSSLAGLVSAVWQLTIFVFFAKQTNPNQSNRRSMVQWKFPLWYSLARVLKCTIYFFPVRETKRCVLTSTGMLQSLQKILQKLVGFFFATMNKIFVFGSLLVSVSVSVSAMFNESQIGSAREKRIRKFPLSYTYLA